MKSTTSAATIEKMREMFAIHGLPATLVSDNGSNFTSSEFEEFMKKNGIRHVKVGSILPSLEWLGRESCTHLQRGFREDGERKCANEVTSRFFLSYRTTPHSTTGVSPAELLMRRNLHTHLDRMLPTIADRVKDKQCQQKTAHDYHVKGNPGRPNCLRK